VPPSTFALSGYGGHVVLRFARASLPTLRQAQGSCSLARATAAAARRAGPVHTHPLPALGLSSIRKLYTDLAPSGGCGVRASPSLRPWRG